jgi:8-oxo-dGTP pyrophosphatase MutT (NUDIX family)
VEREFSAGAVLLRRINGQDHVAVVRPEGKPPGTWALPKGRLEPGESGLEAAVREAAEETGVHGRLVRKLGDVRYVYTWGGQRIFKVVSFFQLRATHGRIDDLAPEMRREVAEARWLPLVDAAGALTYRGERQMADRSLQHSAASAPRGGA